MAAERYLRFRDTRRPSGGRSFLWPVHVWKVLYPDPEQHVPRLNLFQQAILGLVRAQCLDSQKIADLLGLNRDLVQFIMAAQLIPNGWMTASGALTLQGEQILDEDEATEEKVRIGYAYQDAISGNWLPRFTKKLDEIEARRIDERGYPVFVFDRDSGKKYFPFPLKHAVEGALDLPALFEAYRHYQTDYAHAKQRDASDCPRLPRIRMESVGFVEDHAQPMWLWTWIFPDRGGNDQPWRIADPFGLQYAAIWLRKPLQDILPNYPDVARYIANNVLGQQPVANMSAAEWLCDLENKVDFKLKVDFSFSDKVPDIARYLASVLRRMELLSRPERAWPEDISSLLTETHNLAESVLQWMLKVYPPDIERFSHWRIQNEWKIGEARNYLESCHLACLTEEVIMRLFKQSLHQVRTAVTRKGSTPLKALLFAALLATFNQEKHPYHSFTSDGLQLSRLLDMADARNKKAGHSSSDRATKEEALAYAEFVVQWVQLFKKWY